MAINNDGALWTRPTDYLLPRALELLDVDTATGVCRWKVCASRRMKAGDVAGVVTPAGYTRISIGRVKVRAHRVVWFAAHGTPPPKNLDHINQRRTNGALSNAITNLREATYAENSANRKPSHNNLSGFPGVERKGRKYRARVYRYGKKVSLGIFSCPVLAWAAYTGAQFAKHGMRARCDLPGRVEAMYAAAAAADEVGA